MENILSVLNQYNSYIFYINIGLLLILLVVLLRFALKSKHSAQLIKETNNSVNDLAIKAEASKTKYEIVKNDFQHKTKIFGKVVSTVAILKYLRKRENRRKEKEFKKFQKHQQQLSQFFK